MQGWSGKLTCRGRIEFLSFMFMNDLFMNDVGVPFIQSHYP